MSETHAAAPWWSRHPAAAAALLGFVVHIGSLAGGFLYDDQRVILENTSLFDLGNLRWVLSYDKTRPLLNLTWALNYAVSGYAPWSYHMVNLALHAANAALVTLLFGRLTRDRGPRLAFAAGALFAVTPMAVETVGYVASRSTALATLFMLITLLLAIEGLERGSWTYIAGALGANLLALASKEEAASIPLYLLLLDLFFLSATVSGVTTRWRRHVPFWSLPVLALVAHRVLLGRWLPEPAIDPWRYAVTQLALFPRYLARAVVPLDPAFYRGTPAPWPPDATNVLTAAIAIGLFVLAFRWRARRPEGAFAVFWMAAGLLPSSSLVALKEMEVDHRAYLGGAAALFAVASFALRAARGRWLVAWGIVLALVSMRYQWVLMNPIRAWSDAARRAPESLEAVRQLGEAHAAHGDSQDAERELRRALVLDETDPRAWTNLGAIWLETGRRQEAIEAFRRAAELAPRDARIRDNLATVLRAAGDIDGAIQELEAALVGEPRLAHPRIALASILIDRREFARARALIEEVRQTPRDVQDEADLDQVLAKLYEHDQ